MASLLSLYGEVFERYMGLWRTCWEVCAGYMVLFVKDMFWRLYRVQCGVSTCTGYVLEIVQYRCSECAEYMAEFVQDMTRSDFALLTVLS